MLQPKPVLRVLFTLDCPTAGPRAVPYGPPNWEQSARAIDAFCGQLLDAGFPPTVFVTPEAAAEHGPMLEDLAAGGVDVGLLVYPPLLRAAGHKHLLGAYKRETQEEIVAEAKRRLTETIGRRPLSVRSALFSANDDTFAALDAQGFRQASVSSPGRRVRKHHADWTGAAPDPHPASATDRRSAGDLALLEVPVTTDGSQTSDGVAPDLAIENGTVERWHAPLIEAQLQRQDDAAVSFRTLCFVTSTRFGYHDPTTRQRQTLDELVGYVDALSDRYELTPLTLAATAVEYHG